MNEVGSIAVLLNSHGLNGRDIQPAECLEFALSFPIAGKDHLIHATPVVTPTSVVIMGQEVRRQHWQIGRRRFCPACLSENPHHRVWWDMPAYARCPYHDLDVLDRDASGRPVPWWSASFTHTPSGADLLRYGVPRRAEPRPSLEAYILARMGIASPLPVPPLDGLRTLGEALDLVELVGRVSLGVTLRTRPVVGVTKGFDLPAVMRAGYGVLARGRLPSTPCSTTSRTRARPPRRAEGRLASGGSVRSSVRSRARTWSFWPAPCAGSRSREATSRRRPAMPGTPARPAGCRSRPWRRNSASRRNGFAASPRRSVSMNGSSARRASAIGPSVPSRRTWSGGPWRPRSTGTEPPMRWAFRARPSTRSWPPASSPTSCASAREATATGSGQRTWPRLPRAFCGGPRP
ncbi:TniQ family protein [Methylobacterium gregans]|uniref:TniQ family protein n=1 Tax=Methylobacterium gregans TaxID=374424 RepID=UPI0036220A78